MPRPAQPEDTEPQDTEVQDTADAERRRAGRWDKTPAPGQTIPGPTYLNPNADEHYEPAAPHDGEGRHDDERS